MGSVTLHRRHASPIRRCAALGNSLAVPDVRWILERVKASVLGTLELHHWPEQEWAVNDNLAAVGKVKANMRRRQAVGVGSRQKTRENDLGLGEVKFRYEPEEKWRWAA